jgi:Metallopeptidase toxin 3
MNLLTRSEPDFTNLIETLLPRVARVPLVAAAMKKYTSGYLNEARLTTAVSVGTLPSISLTTVGGAAGGEQSGDNLFIDANYFKYFKERSPEYLVLVPATVFHELGHWGYWKGQLEGHPSDKYGREHNNHGEYLSPLSAELHRVFRTLIALGIW